MTAQSIGIFTIEFPDPYRIDYTNDKFVTLASNNSFQYSIPNNIQTLSTKNVERGNDPYGILYVPELASDGCKQAEQEHVPANATRLRNLPQGSNYALIAIAPWFSPSCIDEYFQSARTSLVKAMFVYQPGTSAAMPPPMNDPSWGLGDGGSWKSANNFPTYAIMPISGSIITDQLGQYSGNITDVPDGHELASMFSPTDYIRLWATVSTEAGSQLPNLWVFLVIVLGLLLLVIVTTSTGMHMVQRRRRNNLRQRVINGEVDLEALGVKRLTVPREYLDKLPLYTYSGPGYDAEKTLPQAPERTHNLPSPKVEAETWAKSAPLTRTLSAPTTTAALPAFSQPTCSICLDDFESNVTQVRELPCRHIFHPDCVDTFLLSNSSLCPVCKGSVLPGGYCPAKITNIMVRRERIIRRMHQRNTSGGAGGSTGDEAATQGATPRAFGSLGSRIGGAITGRRVFSAPERMRSQPADIEMAASDPATTATTATAPSGPSAGPESSPAAQCAEQPAADRREWAQQRALAMLGSRPLPTNAEDEETGGRWKRRFRRVFPGFR